MSKAFQSQCSRRTPTLVRRTPSPNLAEEDVEASEADVTPSSNAADIETEATRLAFCRQEKRQGTVTRNRAESSVWRAPDVEATYVRIQTVSQLIVRIDVPEGVRVTQFVCDVENSSIQLEIKRKTCRTCPLFASVRPELSSWCLVGSDFHELTLIKDEKKETQLTFCSPLP